MDDLRIAVAGHVDHGKSTIIGRLLYDTGSLPQQVEDEFSGPCAAAAFAFITDQLSEEQEGSFTLDTTQARLRMSRRDYTLIDTPGHREFLKNMVTGTTRADAAILVVDAAEGPLPQTYLHAYLISMLGIRQVIVVINKMDLASYDPERFGVLSHQLSSHLERIGITPVAVIPISAQEGEHIVRQSTRMPWNGTPTLMQALQELTLQEHVVHKPLRFLVQCPFPVNGRRAILGKVASGNIRQGQTIIFGPAGHETAVAAVMLGQQKTQMATAGQCAGLFLEDPAPVARGHVGFETDNAPLTTDQIAARVFWVSTQPLAVNNRIGILCGTQNCAGHVERIARVINPISLDAIETEAAHLSDSQVAEIIIRTDSLVCVDPFGVVPELGRFAILQDGRIAGGGVIARSQEA